MAASPFDHLHPDIRHLATADRQARKTCILTDRWISYPAGEDAIERLFELVDMPPRVRMPSILFWASPNMGKTHIQKRFLDLCAARDAKDQPTSFGAVLWLELNDSLTEKRLYLDILTALDAPAPDTTTPRLQAMVLRHLSARRIRLGIFDELQRVTELRAKDQRAILNVLKYLSNQLSMSLDLLAHPMRPGPRPPYAWSVCRRCLEKDQNQGRAPYIRRAWTHPLSAFCRAHNSPLVPHGNSRIKIASDLTLFGDGVEPQEPVDNLLGVVAFDDDTIVARVFQVLDGTETIRRLEDRLGLRWAVRDIIDALATNMRTVSAGSLAALLEQPLFQRKSLQGSNSLQMDWWSDIDAATRLLYVRLALAILADPGDPVRNPKTSPLGPNWLTLRYRHAKIQGWQSVFTHAVPDLLFLLVMELPRHAVQEINERSMAWPADLRRRWIYAVAVGAVGGFVW